MRPRPPRLPQLFSSRRSWAEPGFARAQPAQPVDGEPLGRRGVRGNHGFLRDNRGTWEECLALLPPGPDAVHTLPLPRRVKGSTDIWAEPGSARREPESLPYSRSEKEGAPAGTMGSPVPC